MTGQTFPRANAAFYNPAFAYTKHHRFEHKRP